MSGNSQDLEMLDPKNLRTEVQIQLALSSLESVLTRHNFVALFESLLSRHSNVLPFILSGTY
jgi:hypothetical protein